MVVDGESGAMQVVVQPVIIYSAMPRLAWLTLLNLLAEDLFYTVVVVDCIDTSTLSRVSETTVLEMRESMPNFMF